MDRRAVDEGTVGLRPVGRCEREARHPVVDRRVADEFAVGLGGRLLGVWRRGEEEPELGRRRRDGDACGVADGSGTDVVAVEDERPSDAQVVRIRQVDFDDRGGRAGSAAGSRKRLRRNQLLEHDIIDRERDGESASATSDDECTITRDENLLAGEGTVRPAGIGDRDRPTLRPGAAAIIDVDVVQDAVLAQREDAGAIGLHDVGFVDTFDLDVRDREVGRGFVTVVTSCHLHRDGTVGSTAVGTARSALLARVGRSNVTLHDHHVIHAEPVLLVVETVRSDTLSALRVDVVEESIAFVELAERHLRKALRVVDAGRVATRVVGSRRIVGSPRVVRVLGFVVGTTGTVGCVGTAGAHRQERCRKDRGDQCRAPHGGVTSVLRDRFPP